MACQQSEDESRFEKDSFHVYKENTKSKERGTDEK